MIGGGKYDTECAELHRKLEAEGVLVLVLNGDRGSGFSATMPLEMALRIPGILREVAANIENQHRKGTL